MKFGTYGTFDTESVIDVAQRIVAQLQDAGVDHVAGLNIYLTPTDKTGRHRKFVKDGLELDEMRIECWDIALPEQESEISTVYANEPSAGKKATCSNPRKAYHRGKTRRSK